jgi:putative transposase
MLRSHKIRLNPSPEQLKYFAMAAGTRRFVYNWGLEEWKRQYKEGRNPSAMSLKKEFNTIKATQFPWVYEVTKCAVEGAFMDLGNAFKRFFDGRKKGHKVGFPKFKAKKRNREGFYLANDMFSIQGNWIRIAKLGLVNIAEELRFEGKIMSARFTQTAGWWFVSITVEIAEIFETNKGGVVGLDLGINRLATLSDGRKFENQKPLRKQLEKVRRFHQDLSRKQKGSKNRDKSRLKLARLYYRIVSKREDILHKITTAIAEDYGFVGVETLNLKGMLKNHHIALALSDAALGQFHDLLICKVESHNGILQAVGRFFPSSKRCYVCHCIRESLSLAERTFVCESCGLSIDRDYNASLNILQEAIRLFELNLH